MPHNVLIDGTRYVPQRDECSARTPLCLLLRNARKEAGETLEEAARAIKTTKSHIHGLENPCKPTNPHLGLLQRLLRHYDIDFYDIADVNDKTGDSHVKQ